MANDQAMIGPQTTWEASLEFLPRPILLGLVSQEITKTMTDFLQSSDTLDHLIAASQQHERSTLMSGIQADSAPEVDRGDAQTQKNLQAAGFCSDGGITANHQLLCGHIVTTATPTSFGSKLPCGPTCTRYAILSRCGIPLGAYQDICNLPFVCPLCIESFLYDKYDIILGMHKTSRLLFSHSRTSNVRLWAHRMVKRCVEKQGMRFAQKLTRSLVDGSLIVQAESSLYQREPRSPTGRREERRAFPQSFPRANTYDRNRRDSRMRRGRSRSPDEAFEADITPYRSERSDRDRSPVRSQIPGYDRELNDICDRLLDVNVGLSKEDPDMQQLICGVQGLEAKEENKTD